MGYNYSHIDRDNSNWFLSDNSKATLLGINLISGCLRSLNKFQVEFKYPISVIAGKNGSGKSTILALVACAFHNSKDGFKLPERDIPYYTFSDFLVQSKEDTSPEGIVISYKILYNRLKTSDKTAKETEIVPQTISKKIGGKWSKYSRRINRNVIYFGIDRVVPHSEKSVSKSYRKYFKKAETNGWEESVKDIVGKILNKNYDEFWYDKHTKYQLPIVKTTDYTYSGFNMGAGENALFKIFSTIFSCPAGALFVIDEIELGLHGEAQIRLIEELKKICIKKHIQIVCTTHSSIIMSRLPPEARLFVENVGNGTIVTSGISALYAAGKMDGKNGNELDIFVEDGTAKSLIELSLSNEIRLRINILPIGSSEAVVRQLTARYKNIKKGECFAILDGDKRTKMVSLCNQFINMLESVDDKDTAESYIKERLNFLPGDTWPEKWILSEIKKKYVPELAAEFSIGETLLHAYLDEALRADKHNEFHTISGRTNLDESYIKSSFCRNAAKCNKEEFEKIEESILKFLQ